VLGVLAVQSFAPGSYGDREVALLTQMAAITGSVIERWRWRERSQTDLQRRTTELEAILAGMGEGLIITDERGAVVRFNANARGLLAGADGWIVVGAPLDQLAGAADEPVAAALAVLVDGLRRQQPNQLIDIDVTRGEQHLLLNLSATPLPDGNGGLIVIRDVTEHRTLDRLRAQILRVASHDLQSPLTAIKGRGQLLLRSLGADEKPDLNTVRDGLSTMVQQSARLSEMVRLLLDISRLSADGRLDIQRRPTDLVELIGDAVELLQPVSSGYEFDTILPARLEGNWDGPRLRQVVQNLISNAVKYSPRGGRVRVFARREGDQVSVDVSDEGIGLSPDEIDRVFDQFYRAPDALALEGSGLGLFICKAIISAHGGHIRAASGGRNAGSTFSFSIPV
jgi:signal transduction histidine kinase